MRDGRERRDGREIGAVRETKDGMERSPPPPPPPHESPTVHYVHMHKDNRYCIHTSLFTCSQPHPGPVRGGGSKQDYLPWASRYNRGPMVQNCIVLWLKQWYAV